MDLLNCKREYLRVELSSVTQDFGGNARKSDITESDFLRKTSMHQDFCRT